MQIQERVYSIRETAGEHHGLVWMDEINGRVERQILPGMLDKMPRVFDCYSRENTLLAIVAK